SFGKFNINTGESALFTGPSSIENIIGRITGGSISNIDGLLKSDIFGANLYLLNPYGFIFGENAKLDLTGSFYVTTADYAKFKDGSKYSAKEPSQSLITSSPIESFGFLGDNPGKIQIQNVKTDTTSINMSNGGTYSFKGLNLSEGKTFSIIGGDIEISGSGINAPGGQVNIASIASIGEINIENMKTDNFSSLGNIKISNKSIIDVTAQTPGKIIIRGGKFEIHNSTIASFNVGDGKGGLIDIKTNDSIHANNGVIANYSAYGTGDAGDINIAGNDILFENFSQISSSSMNTGNSGNIKIESSNLTISSGTFLNSSCFSEEGKGNGGNIEINSKESVILTGTAIVNGNTKTSIINASTINDGRGGDIKISTKYLEISDSAAIGASSLGNGDSGNLEINVENIKLSSNAKIYALTSKKGDGGNITINSSDSFKISQGQIYAATTGDGNAGAISINSPSVDINDKSSIFIKTLGSGYGGSIEINSNTFTISNESQINADTTNIGNGGNITINSDNLTIGKNARISANAMNDGNAGSITINSEKFSMVDGGQINSKSKGKGNGGDVNITANQSINIYGFGSDASGIDSSSNEGAIGKGGSVTLNSPEVTLNELGVIYTISDHGGDAGDIKIDTNKLSLLNGGGISVSSLSGGKCGNIFINASESTIISGWNTVPYIFSDGTEFNNNSGITSDNGSPYDLEGGIIQIISPKIFMSKGIISGSAFAVGKGSDIEIITNTLNIEDGSQIYSTSMGTGDGGNITIKASESILISGYDEEGLAEETGVEDRSLNSSIDVMASSEGSAGFINIETPKLDVKENCFIRADTILQGKGGKINILSLDIDIDGGNITANTSGAGKGGDIEIKTEYLNICNGGTISSICSAIPIIVEYTGINNTEIAGTGDAGNIFIEASKSINISGQDKDGYSSYISSMTTGKGHGGNIFINTSDLKFNEGNILCGTVPLNKENGCGDGGKINISVDRLVLESGQINGRSVEGTGNAGDITINANDSISISGKSNTEDDIYSGIRSDTDEDGKGGNIFINTPKLNITNEGVISVRAKGSGNTGTINITASEINLSNNALITAKSDDDGISDSINITADTINISDSEITLATAKAPGGDTNIKCTKRLYLKDSTITTSVAGGKGDGGNITISDPEFVILNESNIIAQANEGSGGDIYIKSDEFLKTPDSIVDASSELGIDGNIKIDSANTDVTGGLFLFNSNYMDISRLLKDPCDDRRRGRISTLTFPGKGGLRPAPTDDIMPVDLFFDMQ
ncbi:MAG: filamentous hemagglutinin N-terminal domain-containing protein, partial [Desulfobacterales bacterium]|nr:filamentous hemagglutinin N-terminal domain-containing protein [Desulfobacterales bacterium]